MGVRYTNHDLHGVVNVYKEKGYTSHDVVAVIRRLTGAKTGHTGTLDPDAEGALPVCLGKATRLSDYIMAGEKQYRAEVILGKTTDTEDASGNVLEEFPVNVTEEDIQNTINTFIGDIEQIPPMYSAIKVNGQKLYHLARQGREIERKPRPVTIKDIRITEWIPPNRFFMEVTCSKGTYIRTLCADIGRQLGCGAHMGSLLRLATGRFCSQDGVALSELKQAAENGRLEDFVIPMEEVLSDYPSVTVSREAEKFLRNGNRIHCGFVTPEVLPSQGRVVVYDWDSRLAGLYEPVEEQGQIYLKPAVMLV